MSASNNENEQRTQNNSSQLVIRRATGVNDIGAPLYDELNNSLYLPQTVLTGLKEKSSKLDKSFSRWIRHRMQLIATINETAEKMFAYQKKVNQISLGTSLVGIAGGVLTISTLAFPPAAFAGLALSTVSGISGIVVDVNERNAFKNSITEIELMIEQGLVLFKQLEADGDELWKYCDGYMNLKDSKDGNLAATRVLTTDILKTITIATNFRAAFCITRTLGKAGLRVCSTAGIILDGWRLYWSKRGINEKSDLIMKLEKFSEDLELEMNMISENYNQLKIDDE